MTEHESTTEDESEFEHLLAEHLEAFQRGDQIDRDQLHRDYPQHADSICEFLDNQNLIFNAATGIREAPVAVDVDQTIDSNQDASQRSSSTWSLARLSDAEFPVKFGEYSLLGEIDRGGMGIVFKARHESLHRTVALKIMRTGEMASDEELRRFRAEAEASAAIDHPNIISIFEVGEVNGLIYFTMAYVEGQDLSLLMRDQSIAPKQAAQIVARVADAVAAAHRCGIIHRDLKPSNILLDRGGEPFLIDFGLAKTTLASDALTCTGQILGTPVYMAPEQARGNVVTPASDIYSLGAVLYELVAGQPPFSGPTPIDILLQVMSRDPPNPRKVNKQVPRDLDSIITRAMQKNPADRYSAAIDMEEELQRFILGEPVARSRPTMWERAVTWSRREPVLVSHLFAIFATLIVTLSGLAIRETHSPSAPFYVVLLTTWGIGSYLLQRISVMERFQSAAHWSWAAFDVVIYTTLIYIASPTRGLLLIGYPMMIAASGLFYRTRFVVFVTAMCILGFLALWATVEDSMYDHAEFCLIYLTGLVVLGLCTFSMIRRVRGLADYFASNHR